jgi:ABC-type nitrate/sulfonate/bicarbonate transport system substrate-binding protein
MPVHALHLGSIVAATIRALAPFAPLVLSLCFAMGTVRAAEPVALRVNVFPGAQNLPLYAALAQGMFARRGLNVDLQFTLNSNDQREGLAAGKFEIAHAAVDNAVAMVEGAGKDVIIVLGGDSSMNELFVQPDINAIADLRGKILLVDAPNTAYALQAKKILLNSGLKAGDYQLKIVGGTFVRYRALIENKEGAATILNVPFSIQARQKGGKSLGRTVDLLGPYQATGAFVMRTWATANAAALDQYIAAYIEGLRWALANRGESVALLVKWLKVPQDVAEQTYDALKEPGFGLTPEAKFDLEGFKKLLSLRAEIEGQWGGTPPPPDRYFDLSYYDRAIKLPGR